MNHTAYGAKELADILPFFPPPPLSTYNYRYFLSVFKVSFEVPNNFYFKMAFAETLKSNSFLPVLRRLPKKKIMSSFFFKSNNL